MVAVGKVLNRDALEGFASISDQSINLIYLDPPFFSKRKYESEMANGISLGFSDVWEGGIATYIDFMRGILKECRRVLASTGSLYLHCDWHASHYLKVEADKIFGYSNFRNEIIWRRHNAHNDTKQGGKLFGRIHDVILFYSKSSTYTWTPIYQKYSDDYVNKYYRHVEHSTSRRYALGDLSGPGGRSKGNPYFKFLGKKGYWRYSKEKMQKLYLEGKIVQTRPGTTPKIKRYLDEMPGIILQDIWDDIKSVQLTRKESVAYPTQKPKRLLERIIEVSSNPGDIILDPMCGSGTTLVTAQNLGRKWIGIEKNKKACTLAERRLKKECAIEAVRPATSNNKALSPLIRH